MRTQVSLGALALWGLAACVGMGLGTGAANGAMCTLDEVPAATLLLPYFEVDPDDPEGKNTVFQINNAAPEPALAHITFWTDWSQPTMNFDVFLTGYDVVTVDLHQVFQGFAPITADAQNDPDDTLSPHGLNRIWDGSFPGCEDIFPFGDPGTPVIPAGNLARLRSGHTGQDVFGQGCMGEDHRDGIARGYITIDSANRCSLIFPNEVGYFQPDGTGVADNRNILWGTYSLLDLSRGELFRDKLVSIEAQDGFTGSAEVPGYTFYGRYDPGLAGSDNREPLATTWAVEYALDETLNLGTDLLVWRDSTSADTPEFFPCDEGPSWRELGLGVAEAIALDQEENALEICYNRSSPVFPLNPIIPDPRCFHLETQRAKLGLGDLRLPFSAGWLFLNLNEDDFGVSSDIDFGSGGEIAQAYVAGLVTLEGQFQAGYPAMAMASACEDRDFRLSDTGIVPTFDWEHQRVFFDLFETGDLSRWSTTNPAAGE